jgi:hypothetical protein
MLNTPRFADPYFSPREMVSCPMLSEKVSRTDTEIVLSEWPIPAAELE